MVMYKFLILCNKVRIQVLLNFEMNVTTVLNHTWSRSTCNRVHLQEERP